jgi:hypothetical protein
VFDDQLARRRTTPTAAPTSTVARRRPATTPTDVVLGLQQQAGNRATGRWLDDVALQRQDDGALRADSEPPASGGSTATVDGIGVFEMLAFSSRGQDQGTGGAPSAGDIQVFLRGDALPQLMQAAAQGRSIKRVVLKTARVTVTVTDCVVTSYTTSGDDGATASVTFNGTITFEVAPTAP